MELQINKDPQKLNRNVFSGKKWWQYMCIAIAFAVVVVITVLSINHLNSTINGIICAVIAVPFAYVGMFNKNGLDYFAYHRKKRDMKAYVYGSRKAEPAGRTGREEEDGQMGKIQEMR